MIKKIGKIAEKVGLNIKKYRKTRGLSQADLGFLAFRSTLESENAAQMKISKFERGAQEPKASELFKIAKALKVDIDKFF